MVPDRPRRFCDIEMSCTDYDHDRAIQAYVWKHCRHLLTPLERRVTEYTGPITSDTEHDKARRIYVFLEERDGHAEDADVVKAFEKPHEQRKAEALDRVMEIDGVNLQVASCPKCSRVLRTPIAKQCLWCGYDWHDSKKD